MHISIETFNKRSFSNDLDVKGSVTQNAIVFLPNVSAAVKPTLSLPVT